MNTCNHTAPRLPQMEDHQLLELHWRSFSGLGRDCLSTWSLYKGCEYIKKWQCSTLVNIVQLTVEYLMGPINRKTPEAKPEIGQERGGQTRRNSGVDWYGARFDLPSSCGSGFWMVLKPNRSIFPVQTWTTGLLPGPVANTNLRQGLPNIYSPSLCQPPLRLYLRSTAVNPWSCAWRRWSGQFGDTLGDWDQVESEMHVEAMSLQSWRP